MKRYLWFSVALVVMGVVATGGTGVAGPSFYGYTGLVVTPTADALGEEEYNAALFTLNFEEGADANVYAANLGLREGLEVGFARVRPEEGSGETYINAKYKFAADDSRNPAVAAGVIDATDEDESTVYVVMSKVWGSRYATKYGQVSAPQLHLGIGGGQIDGFFGGVSALLGTRLLLVAEYDSEDVNFGARLALTDEFRAHFGALDGLDDVGIGISFNRMY
jgi:hypothetical protein